MRRSKGTRGIEEHEEVREEREYRLPPERERKKGNNEARAKPPHKENPAATVLLIKVKQSTPKVIAIAKKWEYMDAGKWDLEEEDVKDLTEQELTSLVLSLLADRIYNHEGQSAS